MAIVRFQRSACWLICDTGSTDGTQDFIRSFLQSEQFPASCTAVRSSTSHKRAMKRCSARAAALDFDYLLLTDADMELSVQNTDFAGGLTAAAYRIRQRSAGVTCWNVDPIADKEAVLRILNSETFGGQHICLFVTTLFAAEAGGVMQSLCRPFRRMLHGG
jgi:hypothetical protein